MRLIVGRDNICLFLGGVSWRTVQRWKRKRGLPLLQEDGEQPSVLTSAVEEWHRQRLREGQSKEAPKKKIIGVHPCVSICLHGVLTVSSR